VIKTKVGAGEWVSDLETNVETSAELSVKRLVEIENAGVVAVCLVVFAQSATMGCARTEKSEARTASRNCGREMVIKILWPRSITNLGFGDIQYSILAMARRCRSWLAGCLALCSRH
jgi:hypothetical protein